MEVFRGSWSNFTKLADSVVAVGKFDGVHLGHRALIQRVVESARAQSLRSVIIALEPNTSNGNGNGTAARYLTPGDEKIAALRDLEPDLLLLLNLDQTMSQLTPHDFVQIVLKGRIGLKKIVIGFNHVFGKDQSGDRESLIAMSRQMSFSVEVVNPVRHEDEVISASLIRNLLSAGGAAKAARLLGRFYSVSGTVVRGFGRGKQLNCPTANLGQISSAKIVPHDGIYAGIATVRGESWPAAISCGFNPTFGEGRHSIEAHLIGFDDDIYDLPINIEFAERIRDEKKFASVDDLVRQIAHDVGVASEILEGLGISSPLKTRGS